MVWVIKNKEHICRKCFALLPKKIGGYRVWLSFYYKTWDFTNVGIYKPHLFVYKEDIIKYIEEKKENKK